MKDMRNLHQMVQEHCDCFAANDPLREMSAIINDENKEDAAVKWLALAALHGVNNNAKKITLTRSRGGAVTVEAKYRTTTLPSPGTDIGAQVVEAVKAITHIEKGSGKSPLALGIRDSSLDLKIKVKSEDGGESITIKFP